MPDLIHCSVAKTKFCGIASTHRLLPKNKFMQSTNTMFWRQNSSNIELGFRNNWFRRAGHTSKRGHLTPPTGSTGHVFIGDTERLHSTHRTRPQQGTPNVSIARVGNAFIVSICPAQRRSTGGVKIFTTWSTSFSFWAKFVFVRVSF